MSPRSNVILQRIHIELPAAAAVRYFLGLALCLLLGGCASLGSEAPAVRQVHPVRLPRNFYEELTAAMLDGRAAITIHFRGGAVSLDDKTQLTIPPATRATVEVVAAARRLRSATLEFNNPLKVTRGQGPSVTFQRASCDASGQLQLDDLRFENGLVQSALWGLVPAVRKSVRRTVSINTDVSSLLNGQIFYQAPRASDRPAPADRNEESVTAPPAPALPAPAAVPNGLAVSAPGPAAVVAPSLHDMIKTVSFSVTGGSLRPGATFHLDDVKWRAAVRSGTNLVLSTGSSFEISSGTLDPSQGKVEVVANVKMRLADGELVTQMGRFAVLEGSQFAFQELRFRKGPGTWSLSTGPSSGDLKLSRARVSVNDTDLEIRTGSTLTLTDLRASGGMNQALQLEGKAAGILQFDKGILRVNGNRLQIAPASSLSFTAEFGQASVSPSRWKLRGMIEKCDLRIEEGQLEVPGLGNLTLASQSRIQGRDVHLDDRLELKLVGVLDQVDLHISKGDFQLPQHGRLSLSSGSRVTLRDVVLQAQHPQISAKVIADVNVDGGSIELPNAGIINLLPGTRLSGADLKLAAPDRVPLSGTVKRMACVIGNSPLNVGEFTALTVKAGAKVELSAIQIEPHAGELSALMSVAAPSVTGTISLDGVNKMSLLEGSALHASQLRLDSASKSRIHGTIERIVGVIGASRFQVGNQTTFGLTEGARIEVRDVQVGRAPGELTARMSITARNFSGNVALGSGTSTITIGEGSELIATGLILDLASPNKLHGLIERLKFTAAGGDLQFYGGAQLNDVTGGVSLNDLRIPREGRGLAGSGDLNVRFRGGRWSLGRGEVTLEPGLIAATVLGRAGEGGPVFSITPSLLASDLAISPPPQSGVVAGDAKLRLEVTEANVVADQWGVQSAKGHLILKGMNITRLAHSVAYDLQLPNCDPHTLSLVLTVEPGWAVGGTFEFDRKRPDVAGIVLQPLAGHPIRMELANQSLNEDGRVAGARIFRQELGRARRWHSATAFALLALMGLVGFGGGLIRRRHKFRAPKVVTASRWIAFLLLMAAYVRYAGHAVIDVVWAQQDRLPLRVESFSAGLGRHHLELKARIALEGDVRVAQLSNPLGRVLIGTRVLEGKIFDHSLKSEINDKLADKINEKIASTQIALQ